MWRPDWVVVAEVVGALSGAESPLATLGSLTLVWRPDRAVVVTEAAGEPLALLGAELPADRPGVA
ncbi:hypothetical protein [Amycolatopsis tucumanensis]|uniref:hypothetical protein n=1 Tax=Amycolatopsis tucumanensis TaxID=401106 RepID=UPI001F2FC9F2|nr:hypothetical protein [Amycolatopsis tucumanensis]MCF6424750.1 hypothetical protein [Amycolatopsis tucumanensis]